MDFLFKALISLSILCVSAAFLVIAVVLAKTQGVCANGKIGSNNELSVQACDTSTSAKQILPDDQNVGGV